MSTKVQFVISDEALEVINRNATERKRGDWLSNAVIEYDKIINGVVDEAAPGGGVLEAIDQRLSRLEKMVAALIQRDATT